MKYKVTIDGQAYEVVVECTDAPAPAAAPAPAPAPAAAPAPAPAAAPAGGTAVTAPLPGNVFAIKTSVGAQVKSGDVLIILEAMKMENEVVAPCDGTVSQILVEKGAVVDTGATLITLS